jgi:hypothetical protein
VVGPPLDDDVVELPLDDDEWVGTPDDDFPTDPETFDGALEPGEDVITWQLTSVIYNAAVTSFNQEEGELQPPLDDGVFRAEVAGELWSGEIEDASFGAFEFRTQREASGAYRGEIRRRGSDEWVPLLISPQAGR